MEDGSRKNKETWMAGPLVGLIRLQPSNNVVKLPQWGGCQIWGSMKPNTGMWKHGGILTFGEMTLPPAFYGALGNGLCDFTV